MVKMYRYILQWDRCLSGYLGQQVLNCELKFLSKLKSNYVGKQTVLVGVPSQNAIFPAKFTGTHAQEQRETHKQYLISPLYSSHKKYIEADWNELPIISGSVDLVLLPHCLELSENPHHLLSEACRIVKPEGYLIIFGFNPFSAWGVKSLKWLAKHRLLTPAKIKKWLLLEDFKLIQEKTSLFRPPIESPFFLDRMKWLDWLGEKLYLPFGGIYILLAQAKVIPLTPMRVHWKQQLAGVDVAMPNPNIRSSL